MKRIDRPQRQLNKNKYEYRYHHQSKEKQRKLERRGRRRRPPLFNKGSIVEVSSNEEGFNGAWYIATIRKSPSFRVKRRNIRKVFVEYKAFVSDEDHSKLLSEYVDVALVRPVPPFVEQPEKFYIDQVVDAFHDGGWWTGSVSGFVEENCTYRVFFKNPPHDLDFCPSDLRIHRDWTKGSWVPLVDETGEGKMYSMGKRVEVSFDAGASHDVWFPATIVEEKGNDAFLVEYQKSDGNGGSKNLEEMVDYLHIRPFPPDLKSKNFILLEKVDAFYDFGWWSGVITKALTGSRYSVFIDHTKKDRDFAFSELRPHVEWKDGDWLDTSSQKTKRVRISEKEENELEGSRKTEENKVEVKFFQNYAGGKEGNEAEGVGEDVHGDCLTVDGNLPVVLGLACDNIRTVGSKRSYRSNGGESVKRGRVWGNGDETILHAVKVNNELEAVVNESEKKRRGRPRKSDLLKVLIASANDINAPTLGQVVATNGSCGGSTNDQTQLDNLSSIKSAMSPTSTGGENGVEGSRKQQPPREKLPTKRGRKLQATNLNLVVSKVHDVTSPNSVEGNTPEESYMNEEVSIDESPTNTLDNQPLSKWLGSLHSPFRGDSSRSTPTKCNAEATKEDMEIVKDSTTTTISAANKTRPPVIELQNAPFEKKSTLWSSLESLEVFQKLPQKPHFQPLEHVKETVREGLAIGSMVTFTGVVERTSKLKIDDNNESIDSILETLLDLETHGFDVEVIRKRVRHLGRMKEKREELEIEVVKLNGEMLEHELEKSRIEEEIEDITRWIKEMEKKVKEAMCMKVKKNGEIESLQLKLKDIEEGFTSIRREIEGQDPWP